MDKKANWKNLDYFVQLGLNITTKRSGTFSQIKQEIRDAPEEKRKEEIKKLEQMKKSVAGNFKKDAIVHVQNLKSINENNKRAIHGDAELIRVPWYVRPMGQNTKSNLDSVLEKNEKLFHQNFDYVVGKTKKLKTDVIIEKKELPVITDSVLLALQNIPGNQQAIALYENCKLDIHKELSKHLPFNTIHSILRSIGLKKEKQTNFLIEFIKILLENWKDTNVADQKIMNFLESIYKK